MAEAYNSAAADTEGMDFDTCLRYWEQAAKRSKVIRSVADGIENRALVASQARNAEGRKAEAELEAAEDKLRADHAEIEAMASFIRLRRIQWREQSIDSSSRAAQRPSSEIAAPTGDELAGPDWEEGLG